MKRRATPAARSESRRPRASMIELRDGRLVRTVEWQGGGPALVLLHGLLDSADGWTHLCRATGRRCIAVDLPGFGDSSLPTRPRISAYAEDVAEALAQLRLTRFVLVGHSLGGAVATAVAERLPHRVLSLVLLAPAGFGRVHLAEAISLPGIRHATELALPRVLASRVALRAAYRAFVANGSEAEPEVVAQVVARAGQAVPAAREATKAVVAAGLSRRAFHRRTVRYKGPVVALWGDRDRVVPTAHLAGVAFAFPHADTVVWGDMGHHPQRERPAQLTAFIEDACVMAASRMTSQRPRIARGRARDRSGPIADSPLAAAA